MHYIVWTAIYPIFEEKQSWTAAFTYLEVFKFSLEMKFYCITKIRKMETLLCFKRMSGSKVDLLWDSEGSNDVRGKPDDWLVFSTHGEHVFKSRRFKQILKIGLNLGCS